MKLSLFLFLTAVFCGSALRADTVYANFSGSDYGVGSPLSVNYQVAVPFITPATGEEGFQYALSDIEFVAYTSDPTVIATIALYDTVDGLPDAALETPVTVTLGTSAATITATSSTHPDLVSGDEYWVVLSSSIPFDVSWTSDDGNDATVLSRVPGIATYNATNDWSALSQGYSQGAVQVNATLVPIVAPEPGTFVVFGSGLSGLLLLTRRRVRR